MREKEIKKNKNEQFCKIKEARNHGEIFHVYSQWKLNHDAQHGCFHLLFMRKLNCV